LERQKRKRVKVEQLRTIEQGSRTYDKYIQKFKKIARGSGYKKQSLIEEFKRELNRRISIKRLKLDQNQ